MLNLRTEENLLSGNAVLLQLKYIGQVFSSGGMNRTWAAKSPKPQLTSDRKRVEEHEYMFIILGLTVAK